MTPSSAHPEAPTPTELLDRLARSGLLEDCQRPLWLPRGESGPGIGRAHATVSGSLKLGGHEFRLRIHLPEAFPYDLPSIELENVTPPLPLPHTLQGNRLCFTVGDPLLDSRDPWGLVRDSILSARRLLTAMVEGNRAEEFVQEAVAYWSARPDGLSIDCIVDAGERPHPTWALFRNEQLHAVADSLETYARSLPARSADAALKQKDAVYLPLDPVAVDPSFQLKELMTLSGLRKYFRALSEQDRGLARLLPALHSQREVLLVLGLRRRQGERALLGVHLTGIQGSNVLEQDSARARVEPIELVRRDRAFLAPRGGASLALEKRRVVIAGCGAVGGHVALALARAGVGQLTLVDFDCFTLENAYRHVCGMAYVGQPKVLGLQAELVRKVPYVSVTPYASDLRTLIHHKPEALRENDLLLSVMGHPTAELELNQCIWSSAGFPPVLFAWLEPLGLGGHALLTQGRRESGTTRGCLECLYYRTVEGGALGNQAAFARPGDTYTLDMLGCGSQFMPFGDLDAQRTAELAARLALRVLEGDVTTFQLQSWKGDRRPFERANYSVTQNYELQFDSSAYVREDCPVCAAR